MYITPYFGFTFYPKIKELTKDFEEICDWAISHIPNKSEKGKAVVFRHEYHTDRSMIRIAFAFQITSSDHIYAEDADILRLQDILPEATDRRLHNWGVKVDLTGRFPVPSEEDLRHQLFEAVKELNNGNPLPELLEDANWSPGHYFWTLFL